MKKIISIFLISALTLTLLCGCEGDNNVSSDVSQIEAVINMSSEETSSETENVSSIESIVSSEPEPSSQTTDVSSEVSVISEVSVPKYPDRTEVPYTYQIITERSNILEYKEFNKKIINSVEELQKIMKPIDDADYLMYKEFYNELYSKYDENYFKKGSILLYIYDSSPPYHSVVINNVTKNNGTLYVDTTKYKLGDNHAAPTIICSGLITIEIEKIYIKNIKQVDINESSFVK